jgi:cytosine/adenosine deaminase-related metal-dependent hydrolase
LAQVSRDESSTSGQTFSPVFAQILDDVTSDRVLTQKDLSNLEVLQSATVNGHSILGEDGSGTLQEGQRADMLLLNSNPLEDIRNARDIAGVVANGRWLSMDDINAKTEVDINYWAEIDNQLGLQIDRAAPSMPSN